MPVTYLSHGKFSHICSLIRKYVVHPTPNTDTHTHRHTHTHTHAPGMYFSSFPNSTSLVRLRVAFLSVN